MSEIRKYPYNGNMINGEIVEFETDGEQWTNYRLKDGAQIKVKTVMMEIVRLLDQLDEQGNPVYMFTAQQIVGVTPNPELARKVD